MVQQSDQSQGRSPRYPRYPLPAAIEYARRLYEGAHRSMIETHTAYRVMGFAGKSGASATALGAARQFGLIEGDRGAVRVSDLGMAVLEPSGPEEHTFALHTAANTPEVFEAILNHFDGEPPRSNEPLRSFLIRARGFSRSGADDCIASFRTTFAFVEDIDKIGEPTSADPLTPAVGDVLPTSPGQEIGSPVGSNTEVLRFRLTKDCLAELSLSGPPDALAFSRLIRHLELMREVWTEE